MSFKENTASATTVAEALRKVITERPYYPKDDADHALLAYDLIFPELLNYRGGWFRASRFDVKNVDAWFEKFEGDVQKVESMLNHLDVFQDYPGKYDDYKIVEANALAEVLMFAWPMWTKQMYGIDINCRVYYSDTEGEEPEAATVTFWCKA